MGKASSAARRTRSPRLAFGEGAIAVHDLDPGQLGPLPRVRSRGCFAEDPLAVAHRVWAVTAQAALP